MTNVLERLKLFIGTRGVQLLSLYMGKALLGLATYIGATTDTAALTTSATFLASLIGAALCGWLDHYTTTAVQK